MSSVMFTVTMENGDVIKNVELFHIDKELGETYRIQWMRAIKIYLNALIREDRPDWFYKFKTIELQGKPKFNFLRDEVVAFF
jgi:hypothetical protein